MNRSISPNRGLYAGFLILLGLLNARAQTTCCGPNLGPQSIQWLQLPTNTTPLLPNPLGANTAGTWIITNLPGYGNVLVIQDAPTNVLVACTNSQFDRFHAGSSFEQVPNLDGAFNFTENVPGPYGPYSWGIIPGSVELGYAHPYLTNGVAAPLPSYDVTFYFLNGQPNVCRLVASAIGLAQFTTNTLSQPVTFRTEYDLLYNAINYPQGPSADTVLDGVFGPPLAADASGTVVSSAYAITGGGDDFNTGWAIFQPTNTLLTAFLPPGSGTDINGNPYPPYGTTVPPYPFLKVSVNHEPRDVFSLTVGYLCCTNCATNCLQVQCASGKTVPCGSSWNFDTPTATTCCSNNFVTPFGTLTNLMITEISTTTNGICPQFITRSWTIADACGNTNTCSQIVTVMGCCSTNCLLVQCPVNKTVQCSNTWSFDVPIATTCCPSNFVSSTTPPTNVLITSTGFITNGACPQLTITETWTIADACGNSTNCSQTVTVLGCCSTNCLQVQCPTNKTVQCGSIWSFDAPTATTCCTSNFINPVGVTNLMIIATGTITNGVCPKFITQTWSIVDACGNSNTCSQTVEVVDTTPPVINCPTNPIVVPLNRNCQLIIPGISVTATDNCTPVCSLVYSQSPPAGTTNLSGNSATVTVTVTDLCGNSNSCHVRVIGLPLIPPVLTCPSTMTVTNCLVPCVPVTATAFCCSNPPIVVQTPPCNTVIAPGINSVTITVTDCHGNVTHKTVHLIIAGQSFLTNLFNTGLDPSHALLPDGAVDTHYALPPTAVPPGMPPDYAGNAVAVSPVCHGGFNICAYPASATCFIYTPWDLASPFSKWIAPNYADNGCDPGSNYTYTLNFNLPVNFNPATATISGRWAADNTALMYLNSGLVPAADGGFASTFLHWTPFTIPAGSGFLPGPNTLTLVVSNAESFTGLRVEFTNAYVNCFTCAPPVIHWITPNQFLTLGSTATFQVNAGGTPPLHYQWYHNNLALAGHTASVMQIPSVSVADPGLYSVIVTNPCGAVTGYVSLNLVLPPPWSNAWWNISALDSPLGATVGPDLNLVGSSNAIYAISAGTTDDLGLPDPAGGSVNVLRLNPAGGASLALPMIGPAGSTAADSYTLIMDVYEPDTSFGTPSTLFESVPCCLGSTGQDGVGLTLDNSNYLHVITALAGAVSDTISTMPLAVDMWNRVILVVDNPANGGNATVSAFVNGQNVITVTACPCCVCCVAHTGTSINWANGSPIVLSAPTNATSANAEFYLSSLQFHATALPSQTIAALGSPDTGVEAVTRASVGVPPVLSATLSAGNLNLTWMGDSFVLQETSDLSSGNWTDSQLVFTQTQGSGGTQTSATAKPSPDKPAKFYRLVFRP